MTDRETVVKYAEEKLSHLHPDETHKDHIGMMIEVGYLKDVVGLLKRRKPLYSKEMAHFVCPCCSLVLDEGRDSYCPSCGTKIDYGKYYIEEESE